jgi:predicted MPP superfamily phosphohydrolase
VELVGTDDPHIYRDRYDEVSGPADRAADLRLGVTHAPYRRVLDGMVRDGFELILAGHTHGGQLCVPGVGALVTNCDLPRQQAKGLSRHEFGGRTSWLHVSAGLGTSPYAPVRFACPPEATLLTLVERTAT